MAKNPQTPAASALAADPLGCELDAVEAALTGLADAARQHQALPAAAHAPGAAGSAIDPATILAVVELISRFIGLFRRKPAAP